MREPRLCTKKQRRTTRGRRPRLTAKSAESLTLFPERYFRAYVQDQSEPISPLSLSGEYNLFPFQALSLSRARYSSHSVCSRASLSFFFCLLLLSASTSFDLFARSTGRARLFFVPLAYSPPYSPACLPLSFFYSAEKLELAK